MPVMCSQILQCARHFGRLYARQFEPLLSRWGLSMREMHVLLFLANNPAYDTARDVAELRGLAKSQVSQAVELLAAKGLLRRTPDGGDRRVVHLTITEAGAPLARQGQEIQREMSKQLLADLTAEEAALFRALLGKVFARVENLMEKESLE